MQTTMKHSQYNKNNKQTVIVLSLFTAACLVGDSMLYVALPVHWREAGLTSLLEVGILLSVNRLVRLPLNPLVSWLYRRLSSRAGFLLAGLLAVGTTAAYGLCQGFGLWLLLRCVWGLSWTFLRLGAYFAILELSDETNRGYFMGLYNGLYRLGSLAGMLLGGVLTDLFGLQITALGFAVITLLALPAAAGMIPGAAQAKEPVSAPPQQQTAAQSLRGLLEERVLWALATGMMIAMFYQGAFTATLSYLIQVHSGAEVLVFGAAMGAASLAGVLQAVRWGWEPWLAPWFGRASDGNLGRRKLLAITLAGAALLFALLPQAMPLLLWLVLILAVQLTATILTTVIDAVACDVSGGVNQKTVMSAYSFAIDVGAALGPMLGYTLGGLWGPYAVYWCIAAALALLAAKWIFRPVDLTVPADSVQMR